MTQTVVGIFTNTHRAEEALAEIEDAGFIVKDMPITGKKGGSKQEKREQANGFIIGEGMVKGALSGLILGGVIGFFVARGIVAIPGITNLFFATALVEAMGITGALIPVISGLLTGTIAGGFLGALISVCIPSQEEDSEQSSLENSIVLAVVAADGQVNDLRQILTDHNAIRVDSVPVNYAEHPGFGNNGMHYAHFHGDDLKKHQKFIDH